MEFEEHCNTAENIGFDDLNAQSADLLDALVNEWNLDRPPMYRLEDAHSILTTVAPLSSSSDATTMAEESNSMRTARSGPVARPRQTRSMYVIDEEPAMTGRPKESALDKTEASMYVMDKNEPLLTFEAIGEAKSVYYWQTGEEVDFSAPTPGDAGDLMYDKIPFSARNVTSANVAQSGIDQHQTMVDRDRLFNLLMAYQNLSQTNVTNQ